MVRVGRGCVEEEEEELLLPASAAWPTGESGAVTVDWLRASERALLGEGDLRACRSADMLEPSSRVLFPGGVLVAKVRALQDELEPDSREDHPD